MCRISATTCTSSLTGFRKTVASSAYRLVRNLVTLAPNGDKNPSAVAISKSRCKGSMTMMNNSGDSGSPCLSPV
ncbi:hypothetical protein PVAP13_9NG684114 [Panicum virgatum]|uniref:Uncharacterized protein n=1 Tax=Panicum virgatum TaxID=38727 RepID=A0A8T0MW24_PANVG|nr:hypothetical protein PVAP13_9NG684114 [Panicum virgatum]